MPGLARRASGSLRAAARGAGSNRDALAWSFLVFCVGVILALLAGYGLVRLRSTSWLMLVLAVGLFVLACVVFAFASVILDRFLDSRPAASGAVHCVAIVVIGLVLIAVLGIPTGGLGPHEIGWVLGEDVGLALVGGALLASIQPLAGFAIEGLLKVVWSAKASVWAPPPQWPKRFWTLLTRCLAVSGLGLGVSVGSQALAMIGTGTAGDLQNMYVPIAGWGVGSVIGWRLTSPLFTEPSHHVSRHTIYGGALSLVFSVLAVSLFAHTAAGSAMHQTWSIGNHDDLGRPVTVPVPRAGSRSSYEQLAAVFSPELRFARGEQWFPTSARWYVNHTRLVHDRACPNGCYELPCDDQMGKCAPDGTTDPTIYVRVVHGSGAWPDAKEPAALRDGWLLLQYWFFYNYDSLRMPVITQWHQSDWEQVTVALTTDGRTASPVYVAFSEHCAGTVVPWSRVETIRGTHPLDFVARGSHANYPRRVNAPVRQLNCSLGLTPPHYLGAADLFYASALHGADAEVPVDYLLAIRDTTGNNPPPRAFRLRFLAPGDTVEGFHGFWGIDNKIVIWPGRPHGAGDGPNSPPDQSPWLRPGQAMLCSTRWFSPHRPPCQSVRPR